MFALSLAPVSANADSLWRLASPSQFDDELSTIQPPASISTDQVIEMSVENLNGLATGDVITLSFADTQAFDFVITGQTSYINGDKGWQAKWIEDDGFVLSLTYSAESVVASVYSPVGKYQLRAFMNLSDASSYIGWLSAENPDARYAPIDDGGEVPPIYTTKQSFLLSGQPIDNGNSVSGLSGNDVSIVQTFSNDVILIGEEVEISIAVTNNLSSVITNTTLTIAYSFDGSTLISNDPSCSVGQINTASGSGKTLNCSITSIPAGGKTTINYVIRSTEQAYPYIVSDVFVGEVFGNHVRNTDFVHIVHDTLLDSDNDGISDFNEDILGTDPTNSSSVIADNFVPTVDIMFLYTQTFLDDIGNTSAETEINGLVQLANEIYANSGAVVEFRPVYYGLTEFDINNVFPDTTSDAIAPALLSVSATRDSVGADITVLIGGLHSVTGSLCGLGSIPGIGYNGEVKHPLESGELQIVMFMPGKSRVDNFSCPDQVLTHELGHNFGLRHSRRDISSSIGTFPWSRGHGVDGSFATVMVASPTAFPGSSKLPLFSNPLITDCNGLPCGVSRNDLEQGADAVLSINTTRFQVANIRDSVVAFNVAPVVTISGGSRTIADTDNAAGESVSFTATATDSDGSIATTQWLVNGAEVATGLSATLALPDGSTAVTFKARDNEGESATTTVTVTVSNPTSAQVCQENTKYAAFNATTNILTLSQIEIRTIFSEIYYDAEFLIYQNSEFVEMSTVAAAATTKALRLGIRPSFDSFSNILKVPELNVGEDWYKLEFSFLPETNTFRIVEATKILRPIFGGYVCTTIPTITTGPPPGK